MADTSPAPGRWAFRPIPPEPRSIVELIADGTLDAELSAQLWLLLEARVPIIVAAEAQHVGKTTLLSALLAFLPPDARLVELAGEGETFDWLPQATELGWPGVARPPAATGPAVRPETTVLLAHELSDHTPAYTWGAGRARRGPGGIDRLRPGGDDPRATRSTTCSRPSAARRSGWPTTSCRISVPSSSCAASPMAAGAWRRRTTSGRSPATRTVTSSASGRPSSRRGTRRRTHSSTSAGGSPRSWRAGSAVPRATSRSRWTGGGIISLALVAAGTTDDAAARAAIRAYRPMVPFDAPRDDA